MKNDCLERLEKQATNGPLFSLLGETGVEDLRKKLIDAIVEEVREQIHSSYEYIIYPDDIQESLNDIVSESINEVKEEYKNKIKEMAASKLDKLLEI